jgi:hypothetical protein
MIRKGIRLCFIEHPRDGRHAKTKIPSMPWIFNEALRGTRRGGPMGGLKRLTGGLN